MGQSEGNMSKQTVSAADQPAEILRRLRWVLTGYRLSGLEEWSRGGAVASAVQFESPLQAEPVEESGAIDAARQLEDIRHELGECQRCRLHASRTNLVFGEGSPRASLVFVGEAPGLDEDRQGRPFVGKAGQLLDKMIQALGHVRGDFYICNVLKCRPPQNRNPDADEVACCAPFLFQQLAAIQPKVICLLGTYAAHTLLRRTQSISQLRGKIHRWRGIPVIATYHPAYLLRTGAQKAQTWQDLLQVLAILKS